MRAMRQPPWNGYDTGYALVGAAIAVIAWAGYGADGLKIVPLLAVVYLSGRWAGAQH